MDKTSQRTIAKKIRSGIDMAKISEMIVQNIRQSEVYKNSKNIMLFYPLKTEVNLLELLKDPDKNFFLPRTKGNLIECCPYKSKDELKQSEFSVLEPVCKAVNPDKIDLVFVPALCADKSCFRLGYGKGYYDRFLSDFKGKSVIVLPDELVFDKICIDSHDIPCTMIITQKKASL